MKRRLSIVVALIVSIIIYSWPLGLAPQAQAVLAIMFFAGVLWFTEALPLWVTALFVPPLLIIFADSAPKDAYTPFFDPIIALLLGGFMLARAIQKHNLDKMIARWFIRVFGSKPKWFLLGLMFSTMFLSFWISNTASTLIMIPIGLAALTATKLTPLKSGYCKAVVLGIAYSGTVGGIGTLVGTPPNMIAVRFLAETGVHIDFLGWTLHALPLVIPMVLIIWAFLIFMHKPEIKQVKVPDIKDTSLNREQKITLGVLALTAALWLTESVHGVHYSAVAMLPVITLYLLGVLDKDDLPKIGWPVLILVGGGLSLGSAIYSSGLALSIANGLGGLLTGQSLFTVLIFLALFSIGFTAFAANTATAAMFVPVVIPLAGILGISVQALVLLVGMAVSLDMIVPVGTPPNAIAYGTGYIKVKDMIKAGLPLSVIAATLVSLLALVW